MGSKENRELDNNEQKCHLNQYIEYCNIHNRPITLTEYLVDPVNKLPHGQSIPDAVILDTDGSKKYIEITTISRSQEMRKQIAEIIKKPEKYEGQRFITGVVFNRKATIGEFAKALKNKSQKDYSVFATQKNICVNGILLIVLVNGDPFFDMEEFSDFLNCARDKHLLLSWGVGTCCFEEIVFGARVITSFGNAQWFFETIADRVLIDEIRQQIASQNRIRETLNLYKS